MSFVFPPVYPYVADFAMVSNEDINYAMEEYASAINGCLREHNWLAAGITARTTCETGCAYAYHTTVEEASPGMTNVPGPDWNDPVVSANGFTIQPAEEWCVIEVNGNYGIPVATGDTTLWILFSAQYFANETDDSRNHYHQFGIMVDGRLITDSCIAGFELTNDDTGFLGYYSRPFTVEVVVRVAPGTHTISPVARTLTRWLGVAYPQQVQNRELIVLDMRR